jgi:hypothetical protein
MRNKEEKEKDREPPLKFVKTSDLQRIISAMKTLNDELCETDHDWQRIAKVERSLMVSIGPYFDILKKYETSAVNTA